MPELKGILDTAGTAHWAGRANYVEAKHQCPGHGASQGLLVGLYFQVKNLHGKVCITFNVQQLLHVVKSVHHWGTLWAHLAFPVEAGYKKLKTVVKSVTRVPQRICRMLQIENVIDSLLEATTEERVCDSCVVVT